MIRRDLWVLGKQWPALVVSTVLQPLLLVFVFTSVLPKAGFAVGGPQRAAAYSSLLVAGVIGLSAFSQGFQAVTVRFAVEFGYSNEIEDRIRAPLAIWALGIEKIIIGALQAAFAGAIVVPISLLVSAAPVHLTMRVATLVGVATLVALLAAAFGLAAGTLIDPSQIQLAATALVIPATFFGAVYYPWATLSRIAWLKYGDLVNPLVYMNEALRATLTPGAGHMPLWASTIAMVGLIVAFALLGIRGLYRRSIS